MISFQDYCIRNFQMEREFKRSNIFRVIVVRGGPGLVLIVKDLIVPRFSYCPSMLFFFVVRDGFSFQVLRVDAQRQTV